MLKLVIETVRDKACRYLTEGRVTVNTRVLFNGDALVATVDGDTGRHKIYLNDDGRFRCTCPELRGQCSHLLALALITLEWKDGEPA